MIGARLWRPRFLQALFDSMSNEIPNLGLIPTQHNSSGVRDSTLPAPVADAPASDEDIEAFKASVLAKLTLAIGKDGGAATPRDWFVATALALRDRVIHRWLGVPARGYGIRYDHGLFRQVIRDGWQQEYPEDWLSFGNPWEFARPEFTYDIQFGGWV